jgi:carbon monoxide dehydrogenase subunit G
MSLVIDTPAVELPAAPQEVWDYLADLAHLETLLPADKCKDFRLEGDTCRFRIQGGIDIVLAITAAESPSRLQYGSQKGTPIRFHLDVALAPTGSGGTRATLRGEADVNPFMRMMVESPLRELFTSVSAALQQQFSK